MTGAHYVLAEPGGGRLRRDFIPTPTVFRLHCAFAQPFPEPEELDPCQPPSELQPCPPGQHSLVPSRQNSKSWLQGQSLSDTPGSAALYSFFLPTPNQIPTTILKPSLTYAIVSFSIHVASSPITLLIIKETFLQRTAKVKPSYLSTTPSPFPPVPTSTSWVLLMMSPTFTITQSSRTFPPSVFLLGYLTTGTPHGAADS